MSVESTRADLLELERAHHEDHDGGYRLVSALCEYRAQMLEGTLDQWDEVLLGWVRDEAPSLWGVGLEALARTGGEGVNAALSGMLRDAQRGIEWRGYVAYTLIRRGVSDQAVRAEVEQEARSMRPMGLSNLAALLVLLPELLGTAVDCIVAAISAGLYDYVEANIPPFVYAAADSEPELVLRLAEQVREADRESGKGFSMMVVAYLQKPFVQKRLGANTVTELVAVLRRLTMD